ncbi:MAG TPA: hypothetical protein VF796_25275 [Humisphaera sp.]
MRRHTSTESSSARRPSPAFRQPVEPLEGRTMMSASDLDPTFGSGGAAFTNLAGGNEYQTVVAAPGGKYVAGGSRNFDGNINMLLARFNANGTPDTTFGGGTGRVITDFGGNADGISSVAVLSSGKILVAGEGADTFGQNAKLCVARYNANGTLDTTFGGGDGKADVSFGGSFAFGGSMKVLPSGKFVVAGTSYSTATLGDFALVRFNANGTVDTSFGSSGTGKVVADFGGNAAAPGNQQANGLAVDGSGRLYVAGGVTAGAADEDVAVARFTAGGLLDPGFGGGKGWVTTELASASNPNADDTANAVAVTPAGKLLVAGRSSPDSDKPGRFALVQYTTSGSLDTGFGGGTGKVLTNLNPDPLSNSKKADHLNLSFNGQGLAVTGAGKIVVAGYGSGTSFKDGYAYAQTEAVGVARYNSNGSLDTSFNGTGKKVTTKFDWAKGVAVDGAGKVVVAGGLDSKAGLLRFGTPAAGTASIAGSFFNDKNGDGKRQAATEPLLADWQAYADTNNNGVYDYGEATAFSDAAGNYTIKGLTAGTYRIREVRKDGWARTTPSGTYPLGYYDVTVATGAAATGKVFGNQKIA